ncbi:MAG: S41 family peptidase [Candidatus Babeliales bacterium]
MRKLALLIFIAQAFSLMANTQTDKQPYQEKYDQGVFSFSKTFAEAIHYIKTKYYQEINPEKAMLEAINAFVSQDPHSSLLDPEAYKEILKTTKGEFYGIGVIIDSLKEPKAEYLSVIDTIPGGPADQAGLLPDDKIVQINEESLKGMSVDEAIAKIKGERNTPVHIKILRKGEPKMMPFTIMRDVVKDHNATCFYFKEHNVLYLALSMFTRNAIKQLEQLLKKSQQIKARGFILDLRSNSGGLLDSAVDIASLFLPANSVVVTTKDRSGKVQQSYSTSGTPIANSKIPIFVLVNNYTASAAEILAGALRSHASNNLPVFIVGTKTFGKGSVQEVIPLSNDSALKITTALYYLPNDTTVQGKGITPDFEIEPKMPPTEELKWFKQFFGHESSLKNSIKPNGKDEKKEPEDKKEDNDSEKHKTWQERKKERLGQDFQLLSTLRLLEMLDLSYKAYPKDVSTHEKAVEFLKKRFNPSDKLEMEEITI